MFKCNANGLVCLPLADTTRSTESNDQTIRFDSLLTCSRFSFIHGKRIKYHNIAGNNSIRHFPFHHLWYLTIAVETINVIWSGASSNFANKCEICSFGKFAIFSDILSESDLALSGMFSADWVSHQQISF